MTRKSFLRLSGLGLAGLAAADPVSGRFSETISESIEGLFERSVVFDGVVSPAADRGRTALPVAPGAIKKKTGIDIGNRTTRVQLLDTLNRWMEERSEGFMPVLRTGDIDAALKSRRYGVIYYVQQGFDQELGGSVESLSIWKEKGLRTVQLTYRDNLLGGGSESDEKPLTSLGRKVVRELNRLCMVVDVSHTGRRTTLDAAEASSAPVTANHACVRRLTEHRRNKTDEELKAIAATGGVVAPTNINRFFIRATSRPATVDDFVAHVDFLVQLIGIDHVGISSDTYIDGSQRYETDFADAYMVSYERWKHVAQRLQRLGYEDADLEKILGLNFIRVYRQVLDS